MKDIILISIPETTIKSLVENAVKKALSDYEANKVDKPSKTVLNFEEGCQYAGFSKSHGYKLTSQGNIPHSKRGNRIYFDKTELDEWLLANKVSTIADIQDKTNKYLSSKNRK